MGPVARVVAMLDALAGDVEGALARLSVARARAEAIGARPAVALSDIAEAEIRLGAGDAAGAQPALARAHEGATALGRSRRGCAPRLSAQSRRRSNTASSEPDATGAWPVRET